MPNSEIFGESFIIAGDTYRATTIFVGDSDAMVRVVPPFTPGQGLLDTAGGGEHVVEHNVTTEEATILDIGAKEGDLDPKELRHVVGTLVMELESANAGKGRWAVPGDAPVLAPEEVRSPY